MSVAFFFALAKMLIGFSIVLDISLMAEFCEVTIFLVTVPNSKDVNLFKLSL